MKEGDQVGDYCNPGETEKKSEHIFEKENIKLADYWM